MAESERKIEGKYSPLLRQSFVTAGTALNITGHGAVIGFSAILIPSLRLPESEIHATISEESWIASIIGIALIVGNCIITCLMDTIGRKKSHLMTILPVIVGWFILLLVKSATGLIVARFLQGIAMGMLGPLGSIIIGEMTDPVNRGIFLTFVSLSLTTGVLLAHGLGVFLSWQQTGLICAFIPFIALFFIIYTAESPCWLISKGRYEEAREIFIYLRGQSPQTDIELDRMISTHKMIRKSSVVGLTLPLSTRISRFFRYLGDASKKTEFYKPVIIMVFLYVMFQFAGINVLSSYTMDIIHKVVGPEANAEFLMVALDIERLICNLLAVYLMKVVKRRTLLFSTGLLCVLMYIGKAAYVYCKQNDKLPFDSPWIPITLIGLYMFSLTVGISSVPFALSGELFPMEYRGLGGGLSILGLSLNFFVAVKCFPILTTNVGLPLTYILYASIVTFCLSIVWFMLPETKDKTLQEIEECFKSLSPGDASSAQPLNAIQHNGELRRVSSHILY